MLPSPYEPIFTEAVRAFWNRRALQRQEQQARGVSDQGNRSEATGGGHMDGFLATLVRVLRDNAVPADCIFIKKTLAVLPGFYRPTKIWDLLVVREGRLYVAVELKSLVGPSFGNNTNNRAEEAVGSADDLWTAFREGAFGNHPAPFVGYLFVMEDAQGSRCPVSVEEPHFQAFPEFRGNGQTLEIKNNRSRRRHTVLGVSYSERLEIMCRKLVRERRYTACCFLTTSREQADKVPNYNEPAPDLSATVFLDQLSRHVI